MNRAFHRRAATFGIVLGTVAIGCCVSWRGALAQGQSQLEMAANPSAAYNSIVAALNAGDYDRGLSVVDEVIRYWGPKGPEQFGPGFGHFYYVRGLLLMGKESYGEAVGAFRTCYEDFPNEIINADGERERPQLLNRFRTHALAQWGACLLIIGDFPGAIEKLKQALAESGGTRIRTDVIALNLARAHLRNGEFDAGLELLDKAFDSPKLSMEMKRKAFMILAEDWSPSQEFGKVQDYLWKHGDLVRVDNRSARWERNPVFAFLARDALQKEDPLRALTWYGFLLNPRELVDYQRQKLADLEKIQPRNDEEKARLEAMRTDLDRKIAEALDHVAAMLLGVGSAHFQLLNHSASYAVFRELAEKFPKHPKRPDALYNLIASCAHLERWGEIRRWGGVFLDEYPEHPLVPEVARLMVESIYLLQEWEESLTTATEVRERFDKGKEARDVPDFIAGASLYHLERYAEAERELEEYFRVYKKPRRLEPATYYLGATKIYLFKWKNGVEILEKFMENFPGSPLFSSALYQAALGRFVLGDLDDAAAKVAKLHEEFPDALEIPASFNLKGDLLAARGGVALEEIAAAYEEAKKRSAGDETHFETGAYSIWKLILLRAGAEDHARTGEYYDEFRANYRGSRHEVDAIGGALRSLAELNRGAEAERAVEEQMLRYAADSEGTSLGELVGTWTDFLKQRLKPDELLAKIRAFPVPEAKPAPLVAWLAVAEIETLEGLGKEAPLEEIDEKYFEVQLDIPRDLAPNYALIKLARWNVAKSNPDRARELLEYLIEHRPNGGHLEMAYNDLANLLAQSDVEDDKIRALNYFDQIRERFDLPDLRESAVLGGARLLMKRGKFDLAKTWWRDYLRQENWRLARAEANFEFGRCLEELGQPKEALKLYVSVYANFPGYLDWSTAAYLRTARILKADRQDGDALLVLVDMLKRLGHLKHKNLEEARALFADWKADWVARNGGKS
ncbi:MAG: tetratricopeptide repeat protein [Verrucomicrobiae bacterium]|nr:tetratricopeptide repeat protein [Verrucomicrobiae bacterium]